MYLLRLSSLIFALGLLVSKIFASPALPVSESWDDTETRTYKVQPFTKIYLEGGYRVVLEQGTESKLRIKTEKGNFEYIDVKSDAESLSLRITKKHFNFDEMVLYITFKDLEKLDIEGGMSLETNGYLEFKDFFLHVAGGASIDMNLKAQNLKIVGEGGVKFKLNGIADQLDASISGAGYLDAIDLKTRRSDCNIEGACAASVYVTETLNATISGVGKIRYKGNPQVNKHINGIGIVSHD